MAYLAVYTTRTAAKGLRINISFVPKAQFMEFEVLMKEDKGLKWESF